MTATVEAAERAETTWGSLDPIQRELLALRAAGLSVEAAARRVHVSRRTAWRRLAEARTELGLSSNADAVRAFRAGPPAP
jgi:DNA-directed RNA polymerase specialized sigma24 family protein